MAVDDARKAQNAADDERDLEDAEHVFDFFKMDAAALAHGERGEIQDLRAENGVIIDEHVVVLQNFLARQAGHGGDV